MSSDPRRRPVARTPRAASRMLIGLTVAALLVTACYGGSDDRRTSSPTVDPEVRSTEPTAVPPSGPEPAPSVGSLDGVGVAYEPVTTLDDTPMAMAVRAGDEDLVYVAERSGTLVRLDPTAGPDAAAETVLDFSGDVTIDGEGGFLGAAFSPDGERLYVSYTNTAGDSRIDEYDVTGDGPDAAIDADSRREVFAQDQPFSNHNGGNIVFGPDGYLYLGLGDGGAAGDPDDRAQNPTDLLGKVLRIDPTEGDTPYGVPEDNPFADGADGRPEIWISGVRNPWRFSFDAVTGDLWIGDVGQNEIEEIDFLPADGQGRNAGRGANLGWNLMEGDAGYEGGSPPAAYVPPIATATHGDGNCSITGGYVYRGTEVPALQGAYLFADLCRSRLQGLLVDGSRQVNDEADLGELPAGAPISFGQDADGELYVLFQDGLISRITAG